jgi:hypothetical protein
MDETVKQDEYTQWFSTYGVITAERIFHYYKIYLPNNKLMAAIKNQANLFHEFLKIPLKTVLNGIILQHADDFHIYGQKLFVDYLLSGESDKSPESQGASTRESLEARRQELIHLGEEFQKVRVDHDTFIARTQSVLIRAGRQWSEQFNAFIDSVCLLLEDNDIEYNEDAVKLAVIDTLIDHKTGGERNASQFINEFSHRSKLKLTDKIIKDITPHVESLLQLIDEVVGHVNELTGKSAELFETTKQYRKKFYEVNIAILDLMKLLSEYKINPAQDEANKEPLHFDKSIGELEQQDNHKPK